MSCENPPTTEAWSEKTVKQDDKPSHITTGKYAVLQEVNDEESESWLYFIRYEGNEEALHHLQKQLESFDWELLDECSTFDIDTEHLVSAQTAKEMTKIELNAHQWHRKFDGKLKMIDLKFGKKDSRKKKMRKAFDILGYGSIDEFVSDEDIDPEDLKGPNDTDTEDEDTVTDSGSEDESDSEDESSSSSSEEEEKQKKNKKPMKIPDAFKGLPRNAVKKR